MCDSKGKNKERRALQRQGSLKLVPSWPPLVPSSHFLSGEASIIHGKIQLFLTQTQSLGGTKNRMMAWGFRLLRLQLSAPWS